MNWKNANRKELPSDGEQVLISANGVYYIATFNGPNSGFVVRGEEEEISFRIEDNQIYWIELTDNNSN